MRKALLFLLFFSSIIFPSLAWDYATNGEVTTKPLIFSNSLFISSSDGSVYLLNPTTGSRVWEKKIQGTPLQPVMFQNKVALATKEGKVFLLRTDGNPEWEIDLSKNVTRAYGIDASGSQLFVTTDKGLFSIGAGGSAATLIRASADMRTAPTVSGNSVLFGEGEDIVKASSTGAVEWNKDVKGTWLSKPVVDGSTVYVGGLDKRLHALLLSNGAERWSVETGNWVVSSPLVKGGVVYFGGNDGKVYAVDQTDGSIIWATETPLAMETTPEAGFLGGKESIFLGGMDNKIYAIDIRTGGITWKGSATGWVNDPFFYQNFIYFGSLDGKVYAYTAERACSILTPSEGDVVGLKEVKVAGKAVSDTGSLSVEVQVNGGAWEDAEVDGENWAYYFDPSEKLSTGINTVSCRASDAAGIEVGMFPEVGIIHDPSVPLSNLIVTTKGTKVEGEPFEIFVNDGDDGSPVEHFKLSLDGQEYNGSGSVNITVQSGGSYQLMVEKIGFKDTTLKLDVASKGINPIFIIVAVILIAIIAWQAYIRFVKK